MLGSAGGGGADGAPADDPVTSLDMFVGSDYLVAGHGSGRVLLWDYLRYVRTMCCVFCEQWRHSMRISVLLLMQLLSCHVSWRGSFYKEIHPAALDTTRKCVRVSIYGTAPTPHHLRPPSFLPSIRPFFFSIYFRPFFF